MTRETGCDFVDTNVGAEPTAVAWFVYVLLSSTGRRTYVGIARDPERRLEQHNGERDGGAKSTRSGRPWRIGQIFGPFDSRSQATKIEIQVKKLRGHDRLHWCGIEGDESAKTTSAGEKTAQPTS